MFYFFLILQGVSILILLITFFVIAFQRPSRNQQYLMIITISSLINSIGYLGELQSTSLKQALMCTKLSYLGKIFICLTMLLFVLNYCHVKYCKHTCIALVGLHTLILLLVLTCEWHNLFYTRVEFVSKGFFPHMIADHGIVYYLFLFLCLFYLIAMEIATVKRYFYIHNKDEKKLLIVISIIPILPLLGLYLYSLDRFGGYDYTAPGYMICVIVLVIASLHNNLFEAIERAKDNVIEHMDNGILILDRFNDMIYSNHRVNTLFPLMKDSDSCAEIVAKLKHFAENHELLFLYDRGYQISYRIINNNNISYCQLIVLHDVTDNYKYTNRLQQDVYDKTEKIQNIQHSVITSFATMIEARDGITGQHIKRTSEYVRILTSYMQQHSVCKDLFTDQYVSDIIHAAPLHDIGKIAIPDRILTKPGKLTPEEFDTIKTHSKVGAQIIDDILKEVEQDEYLTIARDMAYYHHERWDGTGYPCNLKGPKIPLCARIMAIADVYDALRSKRSYKDPFSPEESYQIIVDGSGTQFDPELVKAFIHVYDQIKLVS